MGSDEVDSQTSFDGSLNENLFGDQDVQKALESRDIMDKQVDAQADQIAEDSIPDLESYGDDSASDKDGDEYAATEPEDGIVDETVSPSPKKIRTRSKTKKVNIPTPVICSESEDSSDSRGTSPTAAQAYACQRNPATSGRFSQVLQPKLESAPKHCQQEACSS